MSEASFIAVPHAPRPCRGDEPGTSTAPPTISSTTRWLRGRPAEALADAGEALIEASRHLDAVRLLERAVARGCARTSALLGLARTQALCGRTEDALETLAMIADDPHDPSVAVERDHTIAGSMMFSKPELALPLLKDAAERWSALGNTDKEAWALANAGVASFYMSRMEEAAPLLQRALELFERDRRQERCGRHRIVPLSRKACRPARGRLVGGRPRVRRGSR